MQKAFSNRKLLAHSADSTSPISECAGCRIFPTNCVVDEAGCGKDVPCGLHARHFEPVRGQQSALFRRKTPTSTPCSTPTTSTSNSEFRHPTSTPGMSSRGASEGQKTRINPWLRLFIIPSRSTGTDIPRKSRMILFGATAREPRFQTEASEDTAIVYQSCKIWEWLVSERDRPVQPGAKSAKASPLMLL